MTLKSINEPDAVALPTFGIPSINEPPVPQEKPVIMAIEPPSCVIGDPDFTLHVSGEKFIESSVIFFAGYDEPTTFNEDGTLSTGVKPSLWGAPVIVQCQVRNGAQLSDPVDFAFTGM
jgi:hypothetical protein